MSSPAHRVAARFLRADVIGNVQDILHMWQRVLTQYAEKEDEFALVVDARKTMDAMGANLNPQSDSYQYFKKHGAYFIIFPAISYDAALRVGVPKLLLAMLQQYDLPTSARKKIEQYSRFYAKARMNKAKDFATAAKLFPELLRTYREQYATVKAIADSAKLRGSDVDGAKILQAGPFKVVNTGGFDQATMEKCARVIEEAAKRLKSRGMGQVCYGDVLVSQSLKKRKVLAFYLPSNDEMFIRADLKGHEKEALSTVLHELGHRLHFKFLRSKQHEIETVYQRLKRGHADALDQAISDALEDPQRRPKPGDQFLYKNETLIVDKVTYEPRGGWKVKMLLPDEPRAVFTVDLLGYLRAKGFKPEVPRASGFVTPYASTDDVENFAEMVAHYCLNELPDEQVAMLLPIIS